MCLIAWRWQPDASEPLVLLSNRDEFFNRPAHALHRWSDAPICAGQDVLAAGTWLGVGPSGRMAAVTNYRTAGVANETARSRGHLVRDFLSTSIDAQAYLSQVAKETCHYNPFNLWLFDGQEMLGLEGRKTHCRTVALLPGMGSVSNADFNSSWPKQVLLQSRLANDLVNGGDDDDALLDLLRDTATAPFECLPTTGVSADKEQALSAIFVRMPSYGTRASTLIRANATLIRMKERSFDAAGRFTEVEETVEIFSNKLTR